MNWTCPKCGFPSSELRQLCEGCAHARPLLLTSDETGRELRMNVDTLIGRSLLGTLGASDAKFASEPQFEVRPDLARGCWTASHISGAVNATFLNRVPLTGVSSLNDGAILSIGADKLRLVVQFGT